MEHTYEGPRLISIPDTGQILGGITRVAVYHLINQGNLQRVKVGRRAMITATSIDAYVARITEEAQAKAQDGAA